MQWDGVEWSEGAAQLLQTSETAVAGAAGGGGLIARGNSRLQLLHGAQEDLWGGEEQKQKEGSGG